VPQADASPETDTPDLIDIVQVSLLEEFNSALENSQDYCSFACLDAACFRIGMSGSAAFQSLPFGATVVYLFSEIAQDPMTISSFRHGPVDGPFDFCSGQIFEAGFELRSSVKR
jgi:hypothetical protein